MNATQTRATPLAEARQLRAVALTNLQRLILEHPRRPGWQSVYQSAFREWCDTQNTVCLFERMQQQ